MSAFVVGADNGSNSAFKRVKLDDTVSSKVIGTHSGTFQADEAMGVFLLRQLADYRNSPVIRSRDLDVLNEKCDIVIDVGGVYDHEKKRYDHHQRDYDERFDPNRVTKLSASGLVYRHYGLEVLERFYPMLTKELVQVAYLKIYDNLMEALDSIDTGVEMVPDGIKPLYRDSTGLSSRVGRLNPRWNEDQNGNPPDPDERFEQAVELCGQDFCSIMVGIVESYLPARTFVERAILDRHKTDPSGEILSFSSGGMPWRDHLYELERVHGVYPIIKFVLYQDQSGMWRVQAVTDEGKAFSNRLSLPEPWRGVRDHELAALSNIKTARFVHASGFIGGADLYEDALAMAQSALKG